MCPLPSPSPLVLIAKNPWLGIKGLNFDLLHDKSFYDNLQLATKLSSHLCSFFTGFGYVVCWRTSCAVSKWAANAHDQRRWDYSFFQRVSCACACAIHYMCSFSKEVLCTAIFFFGGTQHLPESDIIRAVGYTWWTRHIPRRGLGSAESDSCSTRTVLGGLARRHAVALKIEKPGAKGCLGGIASAGWLEDHQIQSFSREKLFELCKKTLLFLTF